jgi:Holliday junction DNA helicase RuvB
MARTTQMPLACPYVHWHVSGTISVGRATNGRSYWKIFSEVTMTLLGSVSERIGMSAPKPRLRVVQENERPAPNAAATRTARPEALGKFIGQSSVVFNLMVECEAATMEQRLPDHILLEGPAGLGKTSLARCVAERLGMRFVEIPATSLDKVNEVANALAKIGEPEDGPAVVFVDEIHGVCKKGQLLMLSALEDGWFQPSGAQRFDLAPFCMIAATTNPGLLSRPLRERFGIHEALTYYSLTEMTRIIRRYADKQGVKLGVGAAALIASVGRGTPRVATALLRRIAVFAKVGGVEVVTVAGAREALERLGIDDYGLDNQDRTILRALLNQSRPIGVEALAALLGIDNDAITQREPYLLRCGAMQRSGRGRVLTRKGYRMLGETAPVWIPA